MSRESRRRLAVKLASIKAEATSKGWFSTFKQQQLQKKGPGYFSFFFQKKDSDLRTNENGSRSVADRLIATYDYLKQYLFPFPVSR